MIAVNQIIRIINKLYMFFIETTHRLAYWDILFFSKT